MPALRSGKLPCCQQSAVEHSSSELSSAQLCSALLSVAQLCRGVLSLVVLSFVFVLEFEP